MYNHVNLRVHSERFKFFAQAVVFILLSPPQMELVEVPSSWLRFPLPRLWALTAERVPGSSCLGKLQLCNQPSPHKFWGFHWMRECVGAKRRLWACSLLPGSCCLETLLGLWTHLKRIHTHDLQAHVPVYHTCVFASACVPTCLPNNTTVPSGDSSSIIPPCHRVASALSPFSVSNFPLQP